MAEKTNGTEDVLRAHFNHLNERKTALMKKSAPLREKRDKLNLKVEEMRADVKKMTDEIRAIEEPEIIQLSEEISRVASALNGRRMADAP